LGNHVNGHLSHDRGRRNFQPGNFRDAPADIFSRGNFGKFHVGPQDVDGTCIRLYPRAWDKEPAGRLFRYGAHEGMVDLGPVPNNQGVYFMYGDDRRRKLSLPTAIRTSLSMILPGQWKTRVNSPASLRSSG
jgi:hypothetical protein